MLWVAVDDECEDCTPDAVPVWLATACALGCFEGELGLGDSAGCAEAWGPAGSSVVAEESWAATSAALKLWTLPPETAAWTKSKVPRPTTVANAATAAQPTTYRDAPMLASSRARPRLWAKRRLRLDQARAA